MSYRAVCGPRVSRPARSARRAGPRTGVCPQTRVPNNVSFPAGGPECCYGVARVRFRERSVWPTAREVRGGRVSIGRAACRARTWRKRAPGNPRVSRAPRSRGQATKSPTSRGGDGAGVAAWELGREAGRLRLDAGGDDGLLRQLEEDGDEPRYEEAAQTHRSEGPAPPGLWPRCRCCRRVHGGTLDAGRGQVAGSAQVRSSRCAAAPRAENGRGAG